MAKLTDIQNTTYSGLNHIDALLDSGPDWNYLTAAGNTIQYTFSVDSANEVRDGVPVSGQQAFSIAQQANTRLAMDYLSKLTGIAFVLTATGEAAQVHFANIDIPDFQTTGLCSWNVSYGWNPANGDLVRYNANAYVYLDNREHGAQNANLTPGGAGFETLLHELGHMVGLKHPHEDALQLPESQNNTANTLMSYTSSGGPYTEFNKLDLAALNWIYGGDGLRGGLGINSLGGRYLSGSTANENLQGTTFNDKLRGDGGNDMINGGEGTDTAIFGGNRGLYTFVELAGGGLMSSGIDGVDTLESIELFEFQDGTFLRSQVVDNTPPAAPTPNVAKNANGYVAGNQPVVFGIAEANSTVKLFNGANPVATGKAEANGFFTIAIPGILNGSYTLTATATDAAGNVSPAASLSFKVDATAPTVPTATIQLDGAGTATSNQPVFSGTAEAGSTIRLVNSDKEVIGQAKVGTSGSWTINPNPLADGAYSVSVRSSDDADNTATAASVLNFTVNSSLNRSGTAGGDTLTGTAGNNALQGLAGIDTAVYGGARSDYVIAKSTNGYTVTSTADGVDSLLGVERIQFGNASMALDVEGTAGQAYRVYSAVLARAPDLAGLGFWISKMDQGVSLKAVANGFLASQEFAATYGTNLSTSAFVDKLYQNVLHRPLDQAGYDFWVRAIDERGVERADVLTSFSESNENQAQVIGAIENGFAFVPWAG